MVQALDRGVAVGCGREQASVLGLSRFTVCSGCSMWLSKLSRTCVTWLAHTVGRNVPEAVRGEPGLSRGQTGASSFPPSCFGLRQQVTHQRLKLHTQLYFNSKTFRTASPQVSATPWDLQQDRLDKGPEETFSVQRNCTPVPASKS